MTPQQRLRFLFHLQTTWASTQQLLHTYNLVFSCLALEQVLVLTFDAVLALYSFSVGGSSRGAAVLKGGGEELASPVCEQRLGRLHASTCAMAFHGGEMNRKAHGCMQPVANGGWSSDQQHNFVFLVSRALFTRCARKSERRA